MDAQVVEVAGQEMDLSETYHHGRGLDGFMDAGHVGIWDIIQEVVQWFHHFQQLPIYRHYKIREMSLKDKSGVFRIV